MELVVDIVVFSYDFRSILLIERGHEPFRGSYALPGGHVEDNETAREAAVRELYEETGLKVSPQFLDFVSYYDRPDRDPRGRVVSIAFSTVVPENSTIKASDDATAVQWCDRSTLPSLAFDHKTIVIDAEEN